MELLKRVPRLIKWILSVLLVFILLMTLYRFLFYFSYNPTGKPFSGSAFLMGLRFDIKFTCIMAVTIFVLCAIPFLNPFKSPKAKIFWNFILCLAFIFMVVFYAVDYYHYNYIQQRLNASVLSYLNDATISFGMIQQSYPVVKVGLFMLVLIVAAFIFFRKLLNRFLQQQPVSNKKGIGWYILFFLLLAFGVYGKTDAFNLRWSDAFTLNDNFKANLALNPFQSFFSTLRYRDTTPDVAKVKEYYPLMSSYLGVQNPDSNTLNFERKISFPDTPTQRPNIVFIICESFSMYKSSMSGNPFNTTPYFKSLCDSGILFDRCFTPAFPTARGVWASVTGIPDVLGDNNRTASRNPSVVDQHVIMNEFLGYEKYYFLGGDPTWANIKGFLLNNVTNLHMYTQDDFKASKADVWGIDDKNLFLEANERLAKEQKPFFAIIQTANNHSPYTIPPADLAEMGELKIPEDSLEKYGFPDNKQLNSFRYTDFCFKKFFDAVKKEKYFKNTIFVFVGDHGMPGNANHMYPNSWTDANLTRVHVPLLFYAPGILKPELIHSVASQVDVMPTIASLLKVPYTNSAMGRNLFDTTSSGDKYAFVIDHEAYTIGVVNNEYYFVKNTKTGVKKLLSVINNLPVSQSAKTDSIQTVLNRMTDAYYITSKYLLFNNKQKK